MLYTYQKDELFVLKDDGHYLVHATFPMYEDGVVNIDHTFVDPSLRGQGVASVMMHDVMKYLKENHMKVVATCPYAVVWLKKHKEYKDMVRTDLMEHLGEGCKI
jgi:predicted GNAT family acetyltransferase